MAVSDKRFIVILYVMSLLNLYQIPFSSFLYLSVQFQLFEIHFLVEFPQFTGKDLLNELVTQILHKFAPFLSLHDAYIIFWYISKH